MRKNKRNFEQSFCFLLNNIYKIWLKSAKIEVLFKKIVDRI